MGCQSAHFNQQRSGLFVKGCAVWSLSMGKISVSLCTVSCLSDTVLVKKGSRNPEVGKVCNGPAERSWHWLREYSASVPTASRLQFQSFLQQPLASKEPKIPVQNPVGV